MTARAPVFRFLLLRGRSVDLPFRVLDSDRSLDPELPLEIPLEDAVRHVVVGGLHDLVREDGHLQRRRQGSGHIRLVDLGGQPFIGSAHEDPHHGIELLGRHLRAARIVETLDDLFEDGVAPRLVGHAGFEVGEQHGRRFDRAELRDDVERRLAVDRHLGVGHHLLVDRVGAREGEGAVARHDEAGDGQRDEDLRRPLLLGALLNVLVRRKRRATVSGHHMTSPFSSSWEVWTGFPPGKECQHDASSPNLKTKL